MADITLHINTTQLLQAARALNMQAQRGFIPAFSSMLRRRLVTCESAIKYNLTGSVLHRRSGNLARQVAFTLAEGTDTVTGRVGVIKQGPALAYANMHMTGGRIVPKRGQYLTIPLPAALTSAGVPRFTARQVPNAFFIKSKRGNLLLVRKRAGGIEPLFVLKREVHLPKRDYFTVPKNELVAGVQADIALLMKNELVLS